VDCYFHKRKIIYYNGFGYIIKMLMLVVSDAQHHI